MRLENINVHAYQYMEAIQEQFNQICKPLLDLGVKYFVFDRFFSNGRHLVLKNHIEYIKAFLSEIKDQGIIFTEQINSVIKSKKHYFHLSFNMNQYDKMKDPIIHLLYEFGIRNALFIYRQPSPNYFEVYGFYLSFNEVNATQFYLNNLQFLEHFIDYFNEKAEILIDCSNKQKLAYLEQKFLLNQTSSIDLITQKSEKFLQETELKRKIIRGKEKQIFLTKREIECINCLALGKSMKEIGKILELSPRTIEFYLKNIRDKSGISSKEELLVNFIKNNK